MRLRSGLISSDSLGKNFEDWWTSSLEAIRANHFPAQESDSEEKTRDTSGRLSQAAFDFFNQESASLKTSRATLPKGCITSCLSWEDWVTEQRGEFSARVNAAHRINGNEFSSWPTPQTSDQNGAASPDRPEHRLQLQDVETGFGRHDRVRNNLDGSRQESWANWITPQAGDVTGSGKEAVQMWANGKRPKTSDQRLRTQVQAMEVRHSWATPKASDPQHSGPNMRDSAGNYALPAQAVRESWATPRSCSAMSATITPEAIESAHRGSRANYASNLETQMVLKNNAPAGSKLNPRWVETLMGLPVGWTMPSCVSPVTPELMNCDSSETESCQQLLNEHSAS